MQKVYIAETPYHLLISITKTLVEKRIKKDVVFACRWLVTPSITNNLHDVFKEVVIFGGKKTIVDLLCLKTYMLHLPFLSYLAKRKFEPEENWFKQRNVYLFNDNNYYGCLLNALKINYNLIEDGLDCYAMETFKIMGIKYRNLTFRLLGFSWKCFGSSEYTTSVEVNNISKILLKHPNIVEISREQMFRNLSENEINTIAKVFDYQPLGIPIAHEASLLLTQPLSEDKYVSHKKKIEIHKYLVQKYAIGTLYIKAHPRDGDDYSKIFPNAVVLKNNKMPFEIYLLKEKFHFRRVISAGSTVMNAIFCADEKIQLDLDWVLNFK